MHCVQLCYQQKVLPVSIIPGTRQPKVTRTTLIWLVFMDSHAMKMDIYSHAALLHFVKSIPFCKIPDWSFTITTHQAGTTTGTKL